MSKSIERALAALRGLGRVEQMRAWAREGLAPAERPKTNSHIHLPPNFSAFESVTQALDLAAEEGVRLLGASNYYDYDVYGQFSAGAAARGIFPLFGLEIISLADESAAAGVKINDPNNPGRMYICGKGITRFGRMPPRAAELIGVIRDNDAARAEQMVRLVADIFAAGGVDARLDAAGVIDTIVRRHGCRAEAVTIQERHIGQAFQEALFELVGPADRVALLGGILGTPSAVDPEDAVDVQGEIRSHLMKAGRPAFVAETFLSFDEAVELILALGGIPCYPTLADGADPICEYEQSVEKLIGALKAAGITLAEFIPIRNTPEVLRHYAKSIRAAGIALTGGTEHNTLDLLPIEPTCVGGAPVPEDVKDLFWEGACITAAHQFLSLHGRCGFVDAGGRPNADYADDEQRIASFARLGAAVIETYYQSNPRKRKVCRS